MRFPWIAVLCLLAEPAAGHPYTIDDLLRLESYGQVLTDPVGRWAIIERRDRYDSAPSYSYDWAVRRALSKLLVADLATSARAAPLFAQARDAGYWAGGFSPSGKRLAVFRLQRDRLQLGVVEMATRTVHWLALVPDMPAAQPGPVWIDDDHLLAVSLDDRGLPGLLQTPTNAQRAARRGWALAERGREPSSSILGSGRFLDLGTRYRGRHIVEVNLIDGATKDRFAGDVLDLALSGDRRHLAILSKGPAVQPDPKAAVDPAFEPRRQRLTLLELASGARRDPCGCDVLPSLLHWSPSGAQLLFYGRQDGAPWSTGRLYRLDVRRGVTTGLPAGIVPVTQIAGGSARLVRAAWMGQRAIVYAERTSDKRRDWYLLDAHGAARALTAVFASTPPELASARAPGLFIGDVDGLWQVDLGGRRARVAPAPVSQVRPVLLDGHALGTRGWINATPARVFAVLDSGTGRRAVIEDPSGHFRAWPILPRDAILAAAQAGAIVYRENARGIGTLVYVGSGGEVELDRVNGHLAAVDLPERVLLHSRAPDGSLLNHWLLLPPARAGARAPQLVVVPYPGYPYGAAPPADSSPATPTTMTHPLLLVGQGYAVLQPSLPLPDGPGEPLAAIESVLAAAVAAAQASGRVAPTRPFLLGHSYGGYTVLGMAAVSRRFGKVVAADGAYDLAAAYGAMDPRIDYAENGVSLTIPIGWAESGQGRMGAPPWADAARYQRNSAFYGVADIDVPVLLVHSDLDYLPQAQAERMFLALFRLGKDAMLLRYRGESHSLTSPANLRDYWTRVFAFLADDSPRTPSFPQ